MHDRVRAEVDAMLSKFPACQHGERWDWVLVPEYGVPDGRFNKQRTKLLFIIPPGYPTTGPDDFFVDGDLRLKDGRTAEGFNQGPNSSSGAAPIAGEWGWFSWHPVSWRPAATIDGGDNLMTFLRGVNLCLQGKEST